MFVSSIQTLLRNSTQPQQQPGENVFSAQLASVMKGRSLAAGCARAVAGELCSHRASMCNALISLCRRHPLCFADRKTAMQKMLCCPPHFFDNWGMEHLLHVD